MGVLLIFIYPMQPLFSGNQNIYFLWAMENLIPNAFSADPLLSAPDPYPLFSWLISILPVQFLEVWTTGIYVILCSIYSYSLFGIGDIFGKIYENPKRLLSFSSLFLILHASAIWGTFISLQSEFDLRWIWDSGIAEQGVLRGYLQPSVWGVFLLLSIYHASKKNYSAAILWIAPAAIIHANYLFLGAILTIIYLGLSRLDKRSIMAAVILLVLVSPYTIYTLNHFLLLGDEMNAAISNAVAETYETSIHLNPKNWLCPKFYLQLALLFTASLLVWRSRLKQLFLAILFSCVALTILAYALGSTTLISLNPWRLTVILIPISSVILLAKLIRSSRWKNLQLLIVLTVGLICAATVYFRILGNGSTEFMEAWKTVSFVGFIAVIFFDWFLSKKASPSVVTTIELLMIFALVVSGFTESYIEKKTKDSQSQFAATSALKTAQEPNTLYVIPSDWTSFRLNAEKAVYVDENLVYGAVLPGINQRIKEVKSATSNGNYTSVLSSIPTGLAVKLIAPSNSKIAGAISEVQLTENYSCYLLRE
ncbi:MAG: hypothetical protein ACI9UR_001155 [Bacteroidia bacterium]|jgi:hypothetical protein